MIKDSYNSSQGFTSYILSDLTYYLLLIMLVSFSDIIVPRFIDVVIQDCLFPRTKHFYYCACDHAK